MTATVTEIADVFDVSVLSAAIVKPDGFSFNQFLVRADELLLYHTGP